VALTFDSAASNGGYPSGVTISGHSLGSGSGTNRIVLLAVVALGGTSHTFSSTTYNGAALTQRHQSTAPLIFGRLISCTLFYLLDASLPSSSGTYSAVYTCSGAYNSRGTVVSYTGASQAGAPAYASSANSNNPALSGQQTTNITVGGTSGTLVDFFGVESSSGSVVTFTPGSGQTERSDSGTSSASLAVSGKAFTSSGSNSMAQTPSASIWAFGHIIAEILDAASGSSSDNAAIIGAHF